jgi:hypothetical protein
VEGIKGQRLIKVHTKDGLTRSFDMLNEADISACESFLNNKATSVEISGMAIHHRKVMHTFPMPKKFRSIQFTAKLVIGDSGKYKGKRIGEYIACQADDIRITLLVYYTNNMSRVDVAKVGKQRYSPRPKEKSLSTVSDLPGFDEAKKAVGQ